MAEKVSYGPYAKHKFNPAAYGLAPYAGQDEERSYCDRHAGFGKVQFPRIPSLLKRGVMLGLWSEEMSGGAPRLLWTIDDSGWIFELRITNVGQLQYHGYPVLTGDAFARHVITRAREVFFAAEFLHYQDPGTPDAIALAESFYR